MFKHLLKISQTDFLEENQSRFNCTLILHAVHETVHFSDTQVFAAILQRLQLVYSLHTRSMVEIKYLYFVKLGRILM